MADNSLVALLGDTVQDTNRENVQVASFQKDGGVVGLYFSAHWCPPCKAFTPKLAKFYQDLKKSDNGDKFEIVFLSSDRDQSSFDDYFGEMPWLALPFDLRNQKEKLSKKYKVSGIPTLVFVNGSTGELITTNGRSIVTDDPDGKDFPWTPKSFYELFAGKLQQKDGTEIEAESLKGKNVGLYFSAHWCGPCKSFTPNLVKFYNKLKESDKNFEFVYVSSDRDEASFGEYYAGMPWLALPYGDKRKAALSSCFEISGIPTLVIIDGEGNKITDNGREKVSQDKEGKDFPWLPKPLEELDEGTAGVINEEPCIVYFTDGEDAEMDKARTLMKPIAEEFKKSPDADKLFFYVAAAAGEDELPDNLLQFLKISEKVLPVLTLLNIPDQKKYVLDTKDITGEAVKEVIKKFMAQNLDFQNLKG